MTDENRRGLYRAGGISAVILALGYMVITGLFVTAGRAPSEVEPWLSYLARNQAAWWAIVWLSVVTDILYLPVAAAVYVALREVNPRVVVAGAGLLALFVTLDLAITWPNYAALIALGDRYAVAASDAQRASLVATASYPAAVLHSSLLGAYIILVPGLGILALGIVMLRSRFDRIAGYLGLVAGLAAIVSVIGAMVWEPFGTAAILAAVITLIWFFVVGLRLLRSA